ncbi:MAG: tRNA (guanosine(37)-N1)-methyltransferase TrmD [Candidatus Omnitrophica bacterium]|nr:tRNA (guanosine(37)-N1)-methyltransferase TrmD [Candidatus Omnitrophota bacterium]
MRIDIITIFPGLFGPYINESIIKRAQQKKKVVIKVHDLRDFTEDKHKKVDDRPFGGGPGMVMSAQPIFDAVKKIKGKRAVRVIVTCPSGNVLNQKIAKNLAKCKNIIIICGHYEGIDERVRDKVAQEAISIGDYVLTGGELAALVLVDSVTRLLPGVLGKAESLKDESFEQNLLEYPQYTRPANFRGIKVPNVLLSGNHSLIEKWRKEQAVIRTKKYRPDLLLKKTNQCC